MRSLLVPTITDFVKGDPFYHGGSGSTASSPEGADDTGQDHPLLPVNLHTIQSGVQIRRRPDWVVAKDVNAKSLQPPNLSGNCDSRTDYYFYSREANSETSDNILSIFLSRSETLDLKRLISDRSKSG